MSLKLNEEKEPKILLDFLEYLQIVKAYSKKTIDAYNMDLMIFFNFYKTYQKLNVNVEDFNIFILLKVKTSDIIAFIVYSNYNRDNNPYTRERKLIAIRRFFTWLQSLYPNNIKVNPAKGINRITKVERLPKYLSLENAKKLQTIFNIKNTNYPLRNNAIISLFLSTGMRLSELINIDLIDINFKDSSIVVKGKGNKERTVYINKLCKSNLLNYIDYRKRKKDELDLNSPLFVNNKGTRLGVDGIEYICEKAYKLAGLEEYGYNIHTLRHTAATLIYRYVTQDILILKEFLGHKHIKSTEIYTHTYNKQLVDAVNKNPLNYISEEAA